MKKSTYQTARVHWRMGQALLPEHFYLQEEALRSELNLRFDLSAKPWWGVGSCGLNGAQLKEGIVSLQELTLILESGIVIDVPGNTGRAQLNLNDTGETECFVYVQFLSGSDIPEPRSRVNRPGGAGTAPAPAGGARTVKVIESEEGIERIVQRIRLSSKPTSEDGQDVASFKLARFRKLETGNAWAIVADYLPPMVCVGPGPFFGPYARKMSDLNAALRKTLTVQIRDKFLSHESRAAARQCLRGVFEFEAFLSNVKIDEGTRGGPELRFHPYEVFRALHSLYLHQCAFSESEPDPELACYRHEDLATSFRGILRALGAFTEKTFQQRHIPFAPMEGVWVCTVPQGAPVASATMYWLVKKRRANVELDLTGVKLAAGSRIHMVHQRALSGIPYRKLESLPFDSDFSSEVDIYELVRGAEWDHVIQEGKLAFLDSDVLAGTESFIWWRDD